MSFTGCTQECRRDKIPCIRENCRHWMDYKDDLNCSIIAAEDHGPMTLEEVAKRMNISLVHIKNIQDSALDKMKKRILPTLHE